jgi:hypothetical protein
MAHIEYTNWIKNLNHSGVLIGGNKNVPHGGFPPIVLANKSSTTDDSTYKKQREYTSHKSSVSIQKIIDNKKKIGRFIKTYN